MDFYMQRPQEAQQSSQAEESSTESRPLRLSMREKSAQQSWMVKLRREGGIGCRRPIMGEDETRRLLVAARNDEAGKAFLASLRDEQESLGFHFAGTLGEILRERGVENSTMADELRDRFAFLDILPGYDFAAMNGILRHGCKTKRLFEADPDIDVEPDQRMRYVGGGLGPNFDLRSSGSWHDRYLQLLNTAAAPSDGSGVVIAVIDSGFEKSGVLSGFLDLVEPANPSEKDNFGHGTAMASIIQDVAKGATVYAVRMSDQEPDTSEAMLGISAGSFHYGADILNLSFGLAAGKTCLKCGSTAGVSRVFHRFLYSLAEKSVSGQGAPVLISATGNDGVATGFDLPAEWDFSIAVGAITKARNRSTFSNYGTKLHSQYIMMPGGEEQQGAISEWVGEATHKCYGTSAAAAYASGVLALYMSDPAYQQTPPDRTAFLQNVLQQCQPCSNHQTVEHGLGYLPYS